MVVGRGPLAVPNTVLLGHLLVLLWIESYGEPNMSGKSEHKAPVRVGLVVAFAALGEVEETAVRQAWQCAVEKATEWTPAFLAFGLESVTAKSKNADILVYLGESSRFEQVAGEASRETPVVFVKSTIEELLDRPAGGAPRYRMCTGVKGIARALASVAPMVPTVDWETVAWPDSVVDMTELERTEQSYVEASIAAFRDAARQRGIPWRQSVPADGRFSVFLTMHDPTAAALAEAALNLWPEATVLAADGMVSTRAPSGQPWPQRLIRVRHWTPRIESESNRQYRSGMGGQPLPDFDSAGMVFGTMCFLDHAFAAGGSTTSLESAGRHPGPQGPVQMTGSGHPLPERIVVLSGDEYQALTIDS
jgi:hypothetical protein